MGKRRTHPPAKSKQPMVSAWRPDRRRLLRLGYLMLALLALVVFAQIHYIVPDSAAHVAYARSLLWDRDVQFLNDYMRLGMIDREEGIEFGAVVKETRKPGNPFGLGSAVLWFPFVTAAALLANLFSALGAKVTTNGFGTATLLAVQLGTWTYALLSVALMSALLREAVRKLGSSSRRTALIGALLGTPLIYYVVQLPSFSHVCSMFTVTWLLWLSLRWRNRWTVKRAALLGVVLGLAGLVRVQDLGFWVVPVLVAWWGGGLRSRRDVGAAAVYSVTAALVFIPQLVAWASIYGAPWRVPQGEEFLQMPLGRLWDVLFSTHHGLIAWSPIVALAIAGWIVLARRSETRGLGVALLAGFVIQWVANALPYDWWAGWSYGARRFIDCTPLFAIGLAAVARGGRPARVAVYTLAAANVVQWLRMGSRDLSGQGDPGWNELWGEGFVSFLPRIPGAIWDVLRVDWTYIRVLAHPAARNPQVSQDPDYFLTLLIVAWIVGVVAVAYYLSVRSARMQR